MSKITPKHNPKILQFHNQISISEQRLHNQFADDVYKIYATTFHTKLFPTRIVLFLTVILMYNFPKCISIKYFTALYAETLMLLVSVTAVLEYTATRR